MQFSAQGFPSPREEEWRYTNVSGIEKKLFSPSISLTAGDRRCRVAEIVPTARCLGLWFW